LLTSICPVLSSSLSPTCCCPSYHSSLCSLKVRVEISSLPLPLSPMCTAPCPLCCIFLLSSLFIIQFLFIYFFCVGQWSQSVQGSYAGLSQGWLCEYHVTLICSPVGLLDVSQGRFGTTVWWHRSPPVFSV
jgi:hypothetical protein